MFKRGILCGKTVEFFYREEAKERRRARFYDEGTKTRRKRDFPAFGGEEIGTTWCPLWLCGSNFAADGG